MPVNGWVRLALLAAAGSVLAACALRLGGPRAVTYETMGLDVVSASPAAELGDWIRASGADVVVLAAAADTAWFGGVAESARMELSGPGILNGKGLAFLAGEPLGDTTIVLGLDGGGQLLVQDALYRVDQHRYLNLLAFAIDSPDEVRLAVRALLGYVATDVMHNAAVVMAGRVPDAGVGDSIAALLSPAFTDGLECLGEETRPTAAVPIRLFYGPELRVRCDGARVLDGERRAFQARFVVTR